MYYASANARGRFALGRLCYDRESGELVAAAGRLRSCADPNVASCRKTSIKDILPGSPRGSRPQWTSERIRPHEDAWERGRAAVHRLLSSSRPLEAAYVDENIDRVRNGGGCAHSGLERRS